MTVVARCIGGLLAMALATGCGQDGSPSDAGHAGGHTGREDSPPAATGPSRPERVTVELSPEFAQRIGVRTTRATRSALRRTVRTVGIVRTDETRESHVHVKWDGWIEDLHASFVGQQVKRGDPLFSVYSPELLSSQYELLISRRRGAGIGPGADASAAALRSVRDRLRLWDVPDDEIDAIEKSGEPRHAITVRAPRDGTIIEKRALAGMYVEPGMELYTIADLSRVWVLADLYEFEAPLVATAQKALFEPVGRPGAALEATVAFVYPTVDPMSRTVKVRLEMDNASGTLRPGSYGTVRIEVASPDGVVIPFDAVLDTGRRQVVFVRTAAGAFEPRDVRLGAIASPDVQILDGIAEGEEVVTRAQFLLDSESRLRASSGPGPGHTGH